ncbi:phage tail protein, partial [Escherichia coli]|nr:phage tail protein [Escherichia coli]
VRAHKGITLLKNTSDELSQYQCRGFDICDGFKFIKQTSGSSIADDYVRGSKYHSRFYGEHTGIGYQTGSNGTKLSALHQASNAVYQ